LSRHTANVRWSLDGDFLERRYDRRHQIDFGHGVVVPGSASPSVVKPPYATHEAMDPEAAFVASLSACHMLWFLDVAISAGFIVESYEDAAEGQLARGPEGRAMMTKVWLRPAASFGGERRPSAAEIEGLHHAAHEACFIANSVKTEVVIEAVTV
jgi:organic hydroperoxide reductase OsmC/OhrA